MAELFAIVERSVRRTHDASLLAAIEKWADHHGIKSRSEAIRRLIEIGLKARR
jgi:metal-responsive CopG/Arc/MetJ family transcriptional regulator